ncbi:MAG: hypothetical protein Q8K70_02175 [Bacteroidota bacterium]|nr:hypothetical protein [Bacteroidota bacterium]
MILMFFSLALNTILKTATMYILNKKCFISLIFLLFVFKLTAKYNGFTSFDDKVYLFKKNTIHIFAINPKQKLLDKNILKDTSITNFLIRKELGNNIQSENSSTQIEEINKFEILSLGNQFDSLYVAIKYKNIKLANQERYCILKFDKALKFIKSYMIIYPSTVKYNYFPKFSEMEFNQEGDLVLVFCDSSKNISYANFNFNEQKCSLRIDNKSVIALKNDFRFSFFATNLTVLTPNIYKVKNSNLFYLQPFPYVFNPTYQLILDPYQSFENIKKRQEEILKKSEFVELKSLFQNIKGNNFVVLNVFEQNNDIIFYVKNLEKNTLEKVTFKEGNKQPMFDSLMNLDPETNCFVFSYNYSKFIIIDGDEIELLKID